MVRKGEAMGRQPLVVVTGSTRGSRTAWFMSRFMLSLFGINANFFHPDSWNIDIKMDGLLIMGGVDIDPSVYGGKKHSSILKSDIRRDEMELFLLEKADKENLPVMGICRGMQMINLFYGGTLHQHIEELPLEYPHPRTPLPLRDIIIEPETKLHTILGVSIIKANALHHQAVNRVGEGLRYAAHDQNSIIQAIEGKGKKFILGLQWHPELIPYLWHSRAIFSTFCKIVRYNKEL